MSKMNVSNIVVENIKRDILIGKYRVGDKLDDERSLSEKYGVSRMTIRKALIVLREEGILYTRHGVGTYIQGASDKLLTKKDVNYFLYNEKLITESLRARVLVEVECCGCAAKMATASDIETIQSYLFATIEEIKKLKMGYSNQFFEADRQFHRSIAAASGQPFFVRYLDVIEESLSLHQFLSLQMTDPADEVITYHTTIFGALISKDEPRAREAMRNHMDRVADLVCRSLRNINTAECQPKE